MTNSRIYIKAHTLSPERLKAHRRERLAIEKINRQAGKIGLEVFSFIGKAVLIIGIAYFIKTYVDTNACFGIGGLSV